MSVQILVRPANSLAEIWSDTVHAWQTAGGPDDVTLNVCRVSVVEAMFIACAFVEVENGPRKLSVLDPRTLTPVDMEIHED